MDTDKMQLEKDKKEGSLVDWPEKIPNLYIYCHIKKPSLSFPSPLAKVQHSL